MPCDFICFKLNDKHYIYVNTEMSLDLVDFLNHMTLYLKSATGVEETKKQTGS